MILEQENDKSILQSLILRTASEQNIWIKIQQTHIIIKALDSDIYHKTRADAISKYLQRIKADIEFIRKIRYYSIMMQDPESALEYYGVDYVTHPEYIFDTRFEKRIMGIHDKLDLFIGHLLKEMDMVTGEELVI